jgi:pimeloyl-ACP methyl ester carboxylesterase
MEAMDVVQYIGYFGALPLKTLKTRVSLPVMDIPCPVTYLILNDDRLVSPKKQLEMAQRIPGAEIIDIDSCHQVVLHKPKELSDILVGYA